MRRSGQPSLPSAMTCCLFDSFKTLLMPTQPTRLHRDSMSGTSLPLAGFQVIIIGRFWVINEESAEKRTRTSTPLRALEPESHVCDSCPLRTAINRLKSLVNGSKKPD